MVYWDGDGRKDLVIGRSDGKVRLFLNTNTDEDPLFDGGSFIQVGAPGYEVDIDVGARATPALSDWNSDGKKDLVVGALDGKIRVFLNEGSDTAPDFVSEIFVGEGGGDLVVPSQRSSPVVADLDGDGKKDLLSGDTNGRLFFYANVGSDAAPHFSGYVAVTAAGDTIDIAGAARSRPSLCEWSGDGRADVLIGASDGVVRLYQGVDDTGTGGGDPPATTLLARLLPPFPNPFNPEVNIPFFLSEEGPVRFTVHDATGREVARIEEKLYGQGTGETAWNGIDGGGRAVPSGVYFVRMECAAGTAGTEKIVLVR